MEEVEASPAKCLGLCSRHCLHVLCPQPELPHTGSGQGCTPEGAHGPGVLLALLWSTDVLIACPALVQGAREMELEGDMGVTAGVAPLHPAGAGEEQPPSTHVPPAASMQQDRGETDYCGLQHQFRRCWGSLRSTGSTQCLPLGPHCLGASYDTLGWAALGLAQKRFGVWRCRSPHPAHAGSSKTHTSAWGSSESTEDRTEGDQNL